MSQPYLILPVSIADSDAVAANNMPAFWEDTYWVLSWKHRTLAYHISQVALRMPRNLLTDRHRKRYQKAVDPATARLVGYARWVLPESRARFEVWPEAVVPGVSEEEEREAERLARTAHYDPDESMDHVTEEAQQAKKEIMKGREWLVLDYLAVHPDQQGKGIGKALVRSGMDKAAELGLDILCYAKRPGAVLYRRLGFKTLREWVFDDSAYGGTGEVYVAIMSYELEKRPEENAGEDVQADKHD